VTAQEEGLTLLNAIVLRNYLRAQEWLLEELMSDCTSNR
jgi:hypothetical protein